jgi:hypothetical protein
LSFVGDTGTGFYWSSDGTIMYTSNNSSRLRIGGTNVRVYSPLMIQVGAVGAPALHFNGDVTTGIYQVSADGDIDFASGGVHAATLNAAGLTLAGKILVADGLKASPAFTFANSTDTGIYLSADHVWRFVSGGKDQMEVNASSVKMYDEVILVQGTLEKAAITFGISDLNTGLYQATGGDGDVDFSSAGVHAATLNDTSLTLAGIVVADQGSVTTPSYSFAQELNSGLYWNSTALHPIMAVQGQNVVWYTVSNVSVRKPLNVVYGTVGTPGINFGVDTNTGLYHSGTDDDDIHFASGGAYLATLGASNGFEMVYTTSGTGDLSSYGLTVVATRQGADDYLAGIKVEGRNGGTGGLADLLYLEMMSDSGSFSSGLRIKNSHAANNLALGVTVYSAGGSITTAFDASDTEIGAAIAIGANNITTAATTISSTELDVLDGGIALNEIADPTGATSITLNNTEYFSMTSNQTSAGTAFTFRSNKSPGSTANVNAFLFYIDNEGASGTHNGFLVQNLDSSTDRGIQTAFEIDHAENNAVMVRALYIRGTSTGLITTAIDVADPEIVTAINIGDNTFDTTSTVIAAASFDAVFGGADSPADAQHTHVEPIAEYTGALDTDDECLLPISNGIVSHTTNICSHTSSFWYAPKDFTITELVSSIRVASNAGYGCILQITMDDVDSGTAQVIATSAAAGTVTRTVQDIDVAEGVALKIQALDGADALICDAGTNPRFQVNIYGYYTE